MEFNINLDGVSVHKTTDISESIKEYERYVEKYGAERVTVNTSSIDDTYKIIKVILSKED